MDDTKGSGSAHVLLLPFPGMQGHANPMLQLGRRLAYHSLSPTLVVSRYVLSTSTAASGSCPFPVATISDGFDAGGIASCPDTAEYVRRMEAAGSETLAQLVDADARAGRPVRVLVYDSHLPWARRVAQDAAFAAAAFMTQLCAVDLIYGEVWAGRVALPLTDGYALRGMLGVELGPDDLPPFMAAPEWYPAFTESALSQFDGLEEADDVLVNSFRELEPKGLVKREEVERCIREVIGSQRKDEYKKNAAMWMQKAKEAMKEGGHSDRNIAEFAAKCTAKLF